MMLRSCYPLTCIAIIGAVIFAGCSGFGKASSDEHDKRSFSEMMFGGFGAAKSDEHEVTAFEQDMIKAVGQMTYDEALQRWGPPTKVAEGIEVSVASWGNSTSSTGSYAPLFGVGIMTQSMHGDELILTFDKRAKVLKNWQYRTW